MEETVWVGAHFNNLEAQVTGPGGVNTDVVVFKITKGAESAAFTQGQSRASEYSTIAGAHGIARAGLYALDKAGR